MRPYLHEVVAIDALFTHRFYFDWDGGTIIRSELYLYGNITNNEIKHTSSTLSTYHTYVPMGDLVNGGYYNAKLRVYYNDNGINKFSDWSNTVDFYCMPSPTLSLSGSYPQTITKSYFDVDLLYEANIKEQLNYCQYEVYNSDMKLVETSEMLFNSDDTLYRFFGLVDYSDDGSGTTYYVRVVGKTIYFRELVSEFKQITVKYKVNQKEAMSLYSLENNYNGGYMKISVDTTVLSSNNITKFYIKRRKNASGWVMIFDVVTTNITDSFIYLYDKFNEAKTEYEYAIVPYSDDGEGDYYTQEAYSDFDGVFLATADVIYGATLNPELVVAKHKPFSVTETIDEPYPFVGQFNKINYATGSASGSFIEFDDFTGDYKIDDGANYRSKVYDLLYGGQPLVLKYYDGRSWIISATGDITENSELDYRNVTTTFTWAQIGDSNSTADLKRNNLIQKVM